MNQVIIYTDGSCDKHNYGGWASILLLNNKEYEISGNCKNTTNNRMELLAVIKALEFLESRNNRKYNVKVMTDSKYVQNGIGAWEKGKPSKKKQGWIVKWQSNNWNRKDSQLKNKDLWERVWKHLKRHDSIHSHFIKGHSGNHYNERCDKIAYESRRLITSFTPDKQKNKKKHIFYAQEIANYGTQKEDEDIKILEEMGFVVFNPNNHITFKAIENMSYKARNSYFKEKINLCNLLAYRSNGGKVTDRIYNFIRYAKSKKKPILALPR